MDRVNDSPQSSVAAPVSEGDPPSVVIQTGIDFGALLDRVLLDAEADDGAAVAPPAAQVRAAKGKKEWDGIDRAGVSQHLANPGTFQEASPLGEIPASTMPSPTHLAPADAWSPPPAAAPGKAMSTEPKSNEGSGKNKGSDERRRQRRQTAKQSGSAFEFKLEARLAERHAAPQIIQAHCQASDFPVTQNGYLGKPQAKIGTDPFPLQQLANLGFKIIPWDGKAPMDALDLGKVGIIHFLGQPNDPDWPKVATDAATALEKVRQEGKLQAGTKSSGERGKFASLAAGVSHAPMSGRPVPGYRGNSKKQNKLIAKLVENSAIRPSLAYRAPKVYKHYVDHLKPIYEKYGLKLLFKDSIFPSTHFNLGPATACCIHVDCQNVPYGFCQITALGNFDPKKGGHLVFWDLGFAVEFPPGATVLIPSACLRHGNTSIQPGETRYSVTQYCPGALIQWQRCGHRMAKELTAAARVAIDGPYGARREECKHLYSKYDELAADQRKVFGPV